MQVDHEPDRPEDSGGAEGDIHLGERPREPISVGQLFGKTKPDVARGTPKGKRPQPVNPRLAWGAERRARFNETWAKKRADKAGQASEESPVLGIEPEGEPKPVKPAPKPSKDDVEGWAGLLFLGYVLAGGLLKIPELRLERNEAEQLSIASMNVMRHYSNTILSEKSQDWIKFGMVASAIHVPMFAKIKMRKQAMKKAAQTPPEGMNPAGGFERPENPDNEAAEGLMQ